MKRCLNCMEEYEDSRNNCPQCGWGERETGDDCINPGTILSGRYIVGMKKYQDDKSIRYLGWDALFARKVLIVEYAPQLLSSRNHDGLVAAAENKAEFYEKGRQLFLDKGQRQILMDETKGVQETFAAFEEDGAAYQILDVPGLVSLRDVFKQGEIWTFGKTEVLLKRLADVLSKAHRLGLHHGKGLADSCYQNINGEIFLGYFQGPLLQPEAEAVTGAVLMDMQELAQIAGMALLGMERWQRQNLQKNLGELSKKIPKASVDVMRAVLEPEKEKVPRSISEFAERFSDEITIETSEDEDRTVRLDEHMEEVPEEKKKESFWKRLFRSR